MTMTHRSPRLRSLTSSVAVAASTALAVLVSTAACAGVRAPASRELPSARRETPAAAAAAGAATTTAPLAPLASVEREMMVAAIETIAAGWTDSTSLCLAVLGGPDGPAAPDDALLGALRTRQRPVRMVDCPRTYQSMIATVDSAGRVADPPRPSGYVDPYALLVGRPQFEQPGYAFVHARETHGTAGRDYFCIAQSYQGRARASCQVVRQWIS